MEDIFERICRYATEDAGSAWGKDWQPRTYEETESGGIIFPRNTNDRRVVYVEEYLWRKHGVVFSEEEQKKTYSIW